MPPVLQPYFVPNSVTVNNPTGTFLNASSYQILSAGADGVWGVAPTGTVSFTGGSWPGGAGMGTPGLDDWGNFSRVFLGAPQSN